MNIRQLCLGISAMLLSLSTAAANLYADKSLAAAIVDFVHPLVPEDMSIVLVMEGDPAFFGADLKPGALDKAGISLSSYEHLNTRKTTLSTERVAAFSSMDFGLPENRSRPTLCAIVVRKLEAADNPMLMAHEAMHCANSRIINDKAYLEARRPALTLNLDIPERARMNYFEEINLYALTLVWSDKLGFPKTQRVNAERFIKAGKNVGNGYGYHSIKRIEELCRNRAACPSDAIGMARFLTADEQMIKAIEIDIRELYAFDQKSNFFEKMGRRN